jgi:hypothetical protein
VEGLALSEAKLYATEHADDPAGKLLTGPGAVIARSFLCLAVFQARAGSEFSRLACFDP